MFDVERYYSRVPEDQIVDLKQRLERARWPEPETVQNWTQGAPLESVRKLCEYWRSSYDWRRCERLLNDLGQYRTPINGLDIHFLHIRSSNPRALPLLITHGWPGSVVEFLKIVGPLTEPQLCSPSAPMAQI
ncbi:epoxide hydrolase N-terminal domain-containing protein [Novosphingobium sp. CECT 9465]|uniref:epoxide hydrolase N-terminal domain-containing protein n=1 Tax=Novosphingobium sp. CECT 9465 TaxID=2829794 RepID=UPI001E3F4A68|nr:epoxide hydrolase N-terminal domain-containing protein [Novosphingobium sp. CECT 9465]CAH0498412.1 hypothetical protein NVSP9465_03499 [Novosphingobium sp. CECT 9465]